MRDDDVLENNPQICRSALEALHQQVFAWALSRCDYQHAVAEDLVQQAYVELLTGKAKFEGRSSLKTFVYSVVQNLSRNRFRRIASRLRLVRELKQYASEEPLLDTAAEKPSGLWQAVQNLPRRQRDVIELVFCRDMTIAEASHVMGVTTGSGRVHYDRAKKALRVRLADVVPDE
jgi:RNA polymerase sigma-70 factor (ECF subfamily)